MALLYIDPNNITLNIKVGVLEDYAPDDEIKQLNKDVEDLKQKFKKNLKRIIGDHDNQQEALKVLETDEEKRKKWSGYVNKTYFKQFNKIQDRVTEKNKKICPNFEEEILGKK